MIKVLFINNQGTGFGEWIEVSEGTSIGKLVYEKLPDFSPNSLQVKVNSQPVGFDDLLKEGDRVSIIPRKITGA